MTKKTFIRILGMAIFMAVPASAQTGMQVKPVEVEVKGGATCPLSHHDGMKNKMGDVEGVELRVNLSSVPFDLGLEVAASTVRRQETTPLIINQKFRVAGCSLFADYDIRRGSKVAPFVGLGIGLAHCDSPVSDIHRAMVTPRVGVEIYHHLRLTLDARLGAKDYNHMGLTVGYVFGGGRK